MKAVIQRAVTYQSLSFCKHDLHQVWSRILECQPSVYFVSQGLLRAYIFFDHLYRCYDRRIEEKEGNPHAKKQDVGELDVADNEVNPGMHHGLL